MTNRNSRLLVLGALLLFALTTVAQQSTTNNDGSAKQNLLRVDEQMKVLTDTLDLTSDQQTKIRPAVKQLHDVTAKLMADKSLSQEERLAKVRPWRYDTDKKMRVVLNDDQKKKLDQYEQGPHTELHGTLTGSPGSHDF